MKGYVTISAPPAKRRLKGLALAVVLALVVLSLLVPLAFLLGLHNGFPYGYPNDDRSSSEPHFPNSDHDVVLGIERTSSEDDVTRFGNLIRKLTPTPPKGITKNHPRDDVLQLDQKNDGQPTRDDKLIKKEDFNSSISANYASHSEATSRVNGSKSHPNARKIINHASTSTGKEIERSCQLEFGSYCLWSIEHKEVMKDSVVKRLKDQLYMARAYYPSIAKLKGQDKLSSELKLNIQEHERMLSEAIVDSDLPPLVVKNVQKMEQVIASAKACQVDCRNVDKKLRQILDLAEDEAHFHRKQSAFLYHLGAQTMPKSHHCLSMRLTVEYFNSEAKSADHLNLHKLNDPRLQHYVVFSRNVLAVSVTVNSTVMNSRNAGDIVFHVLTDEQNLYAMKLWFSRNLYNVVVHVEKVEDLNLNQQLPVSESEFRVSIRSNGWPSSLQMRTEYLSVFGDLHFWLPEIFKKLKKVVVLDDDVVIQKDLTPLWGLNMHGKVNGAVQFCGVRLGQLKSYLGSNTHEVISCAWMSGLNVIDLEKWRENDVTGVYQRLLGEMKKQAKEPGTVVLPAALLAFNDLIHPLDDSWVLSGLGHDYGVEVDAIRRAGALHFNGNMKPWLELGIPAYKKYWKSFLTKEERFMDQCNVSP